MGINIAHFLACKIGDIHSLQGGACQPLLVLYAVLPSILRLVAGLGVGGGGGARRFLCILLAGLLVVLGVGARHLLHVLGGGVAGGGRAVVRTVA